VPSEQSEGDPVEHFLVDGVAPAVIGGGPPESPFDVDPDPPRPTQAPPSPHAPSNRGPASIPGRAANYGGSAHGSPSHGSPASHGHHANLGGPANGRPASSGAHDRPANYGQPATRDDRLEFPASHGPASGPYQAHEQPYAEPPTSPIPALSPPRPEQEPAKRKSLFSRMFRLPGE
jgi:hypothetical protein